MIAYTLTLVAALLPTRPGEAETLLREMDAKLTGAKTLRIEFEVWRGTGETGELRVEGALLLAERNRFRYEVRYQGEAQRRVSVSDGKREMALIAPDRKPEFVPLRGWDNAVLKSWLGRGGVLVATYQLASGKKPGPDDGPRTSNVRLLPDETAGGVRYRVVGYDLTWDKEPVLDARVRVWIDPETKLPVRREVAFRRSPIPAGAPHTGGVREGERLTAIHNKFEIDPKLDDELFELPK